MAPGAVLRQTSGAGRHAAPQRGLRRRSGHSEEPAAGRRLQTVGGIDSINIIRSRGFGWSWRDETVRETISNGWCFNFSASSFLRLLSGTLCVGQNGFHEELFSLVCACTSDTTTVFCTMYCCYKRIAFVPQRWLRAPCHCRTGSFCPERSWVALSGLWFLCRVGSLSDSLRNTHSVKNMSQNIFSI